MIKKKKIKLFNVRLKIYLTLNIHYKYFSLNVKLILQINVIKIKYFNLSYTLCVCVLHVKNVLHISVSLSVFGLLKQNIGNRTNFD